MNQQKSHNILAIDNSTSFLSIAYNGKSYNAIHSGDASANIIKQIDAVLCSEIPDYIAVGVGPGAFTGIRLAISIASGLAMAWGVKVVPVCSLQAMLPQDIATDSIVRVIMDARMNEVYTKVFYMDKYSNHNDIELLPANLINDFSESLIISNIQNTNIYPSALNIAAIAAKNISAAVLPQHMQANYVRNKVAQTILERKG
jgi:tRNA threonylcarbamoyladenosine biosynthesis protein TsaB